MPGAAAARAAAKACIPRASITAFRSKGHRANGFTTDGGFAEYAVNNVNTMVHIPDDMPDAEATLIVTAGTAMYGLDVMGGLIAGEGVVVTGPGPIGLMGVAVAKALGAAPVILTGTRDRRLEMGRKLGADAVVNVRNEDAVAAVTRLTGGKGVQYVLECSGAPNALDEAARMVNRGGRICLAAFPGEPVPVDLAYLVRNNIYVYGIRGEGRSATHRAAALMAQKRFDAKMIHTHTFPLDEVPTAIRYARDRVEDAIKVVVSDALTRRLTRRYCRTFSRIAALPGTISSDPAGPKQALRARPRQASLARALTERRTNGTIIRSPHSGYRMPTAVAY